MGHYHGNWPIPKVVSDLSRNVPYGVGDAGRRGTGIGHADRPTDRRLASRLAAPTRPGRQPRRGLAAGRSSATWGCTNGSSRRTYPPPSSATQLASSSRSSSTLVSGTRHEGSRRSRPAAHRIRASQHWCEPCCRSTPARRRDGSSSRWSCSSLHGIPSVRRTADRWQGPVRSERVSSIASSNGYPRRPLTADACGSPTDAAPRSSRWIQLQQGSNSGGPELSEPDA